MQHVCTLRPLKRVRAAGCLPGFPDWGKGPCCTPNLVELSFNFLPLCGAPSSYCSASNMRACQTRQHCTIPSVQPPVPGRVLHAEHQEPQCVVPLALHTLPVHPPLGRRPSRAPTRPPPPLLPAGALQVGRGAGQHAAAHLSQQDCYRPGEGRLSAVIQGRPGGSGPHGGCEQGSHSLEPAFGRHHSPPEALAAGSSMPLTCTCANAAPQFSRVPGARDPPCSSWAWQYWALWTLHDGLQIWPAVRAAGLRSGHSTVSEGWHAGVLPHQSVR